MGDWLTEAMIAKLEDEIDATEGLASLSDVEGTMALEEYLAARRGNMTNLRDILAELQAKLLSEIANNLGHEVYVSQTSQAWGLYATPVDPTRVRHPNNFGYITWKSERDKEFPSEPLPHLVVAVKERRAKAAGVTGYRVNPIGDRDGPEARWCVTQNEHHRLKEVAAKLVDVYRLRWPNGPPNG